MIFYGLDTHAIVNLHGVQILKANNQFRTWVVDVKDLLKFENNSLTIYFKSAPINDI